MQVHPQSVPSLTKPPVWVSAIIGFASVCHYSAPKNLNFQHKPRFGQPKPTPETSSMCHLALLTPSKQVRPTRILHLRKYIILHFIKKCKSFYSIPLSKDEISAPSASIFPTFFAKTSSFEEINLSKSLALSTTSFPKPQPKLAPRYLRLETTSSPL